MGLGEVEPEDLVLVDLDGQVIAGTRPIHHEMPIHAEIYRARPDVNAVVHTHPFHAAAFAATAADFKFVRPPDTWPAPRSAAGNGEL